MATSKNIYIYIIISLYILYIESHCFHFDFLVYNASVRFMNDALFHVTINTLTQILKIDLIRVSGWIDTSKRQMRSPERHTEIHVLQRRTPDNITGRPCLLTNHLRSKSLNYL